MTPNVNPTTGVRYGVIACNNLNQDLVQELFYGRQATNVSEDEAYAEAKAEAEAAYETLIEEVSISAAESGADREGDFDSEACEEIWFETNGHEYDKDTFVERYLDKFNDRCCGIEEPTITGTYEGVEYRISWLGGASILWVIKGPIVRSRSLTSPCVPGAIDLDSGFIYATCSYDNSVEGRHQHQGYGVPRDWLFKEAT